MNYDLLLENALAYSLKQGADQCEIYVNTRETQRIVGDERGVKDWEVAQGEGFSIRLLRRGVVGFSYGSFLAQEALRQGIDDALLSCNFLEPEPFFSLTAPGAAYPDLPPCEEEDVSLSEKREKLALMVETACRGENIETVERASISSVRGRVIIKNSLGLDLSAPMAYHSCGLVAVAAHGEERETGSDFLARKKFAHLAFAQVAQNAAWRGNNKLHAKPVSGGEYPVIFAPTAAVDILSIILPSFLGDNIRKGESKLQGKLGKKITHGDLNLYDDGTLLQGIAAVAFDDQGVPCRKNALIEGGKVKAFLYDNVAAAKAGTTSTGSGFTSSNQSLPVTGFTNYYIAPGSTASQGLIKGVKQGLYIRDLLGLHMANGVSGDFSLGISGNRIENGELGQGFRGNMAAGNVFTLFKDITALGDDFQFYAYKGCPSLAVQSLRVSGKA